MMMAPTQNRTRKEASVLHQPIVQTRFEALYRAALVAIAIVLLAACSPPSGDLKAGSFETPEAAAKALIAALEQPAPEPLLAVLGEEYRDDLVTADWDFEFESRLAIAQGAKNRLELSKEGADKTILLIGPKSWPFPAPIVRVEQAWRFDMDEGLEEIVDRRVGKNELKAIALSRAYVDAQIEYARSDRNGNGRLEYAQRLVSTKGQHDGLYWPSEGGEDESPFGPLVKGAESYLEKTEPGDPFFGYYLRILTKQGAHPPRRAYDYVIGGHMVAGFGLVAYPANYGVTGIMTFVVNHLGKVYEKDIGPFTEMAEFNPDETWRLVED